MPNLENHDTILVFGGTFDPPHMAHVLLPPLAAKAIGATAIAYIPAAVSPFKTGQKTTAAHHRVRMVQLAVEDRPHTFVLTDEVDRAAQPDKADQPSYTVDTLRALRDRLPSRCNLRLLIGGDQFQLFHKWRESSVIETLAPPVVLVRPPDTQEELLAAAAHHADPTVWASRFVQTPRLNISATTIRKRVANGESIAGLTPPAVADYIVEHGLYREG